VKKRIIFLLSLFFIVFVIGCGNTRAERGEYGKAMDFEAQDINGNTVRLSDHAGKVILLNFFATWCPPCRKEMPDFNEIAREYKQKVEIIGVNVGREGLPKVKSFAERNNLTFSIIADGSEIAGLYGPINAIPVTIIIDKEFNIAQKYIGMRPKEVFVSDIEALE